VTHDPSPALSVALAYYHAWTGKDIDRAMTHVADDVVCEAPRRPAASTAWSGSGSSWHRTRRC
jgi:ketosteroid isomerase-like protein